MEVYNMFGQGFVGLDCRGRCHSLAMTQHFVIASHSPSSSRALAWRSSGYSR